MKTIVSSRAELLKSVSEEICAFIREKPNAVITMSADCTMFPIWECLASAVQTGSLSMKKVLFFQLAEFLDVRRENTLRRLTEDRLIAVTDLQPENCRWFDDYAEVDAYEKAIQDAGGLDLAVLGIGNNAHVGLNEPGTQFDTGCRIQKLTNKTKDQYSWLFDGKEPVPEKACTMGIRTLIKARKILVICLGTEKTKATFDMLYARDDSIVPAAFLQLPFDVTVYADTEAGEKL